MVMRRESAIGAFGLRLIWRNFSPNANHHVIARTTDLGGNFECLRSSFYDKFQVGRRVANGRFSSSGGVKDNVV